MKSKSASSIFSLASMALLSASLLAGAAPKEDVDNTGKNERDRSGENVTADNQSNKPEDIKITAAIRQAIVKDDALSMLAKNVKIITVDGKVTLRGPVHTPAEKEKIAALAKSAGGSAVIVNRLEVKTAKAKSAKAKSND